MGTYWLKVPYFLWYLIIDRVALAKQGDNRIGSVRPSVCVWVCLSELSYLIQHREEPAPPQLGGAIFKNRAPLNISAPVLFVCGSIEDQNYLVVLVVYKRKVQIIIRNPWAPSNRIKTAQHMLSIIYPLQWSLWRICMGPVGFLIFVGQLQHIWIAR